MINISFNFIAEISVGFISSLRSIVRVTIRSEFLHRNMQVKSVHLRRFSTARVKSKSVKMNNPNYQKSTTTPFNHVKFMKNFSSTLLQNVKDIQYETTQIDFSDERRK
jgi:hypothetical protein